jgi:hypothetical protein
MTEEYMTGENSKTTLNIVFQGLIVFFQNRPPASPGKSITALIPNVGCDHAYRAGNWLSEISLAPGEYKLSGVDPDGSAEFCDADHTILRPAQMRPVLSHHELFVRLELPQPHNIASFRTVGIPPQNLYDSASLPGGITCINVAHTHVFSYNVSKPLHDVRLGDHPWAPDADYCSECANLHVFASPETRPRVPHHVDEFHLAATLLHNIELHLKENLPFLPPLPTPYEIHRKGVHGVVQAELEDLSGRNMRLNEMGRVIRRNIDRDGWLDIGGIWSIIDELSEPLACAACGAGHSH